MQDLESSKPKRVHLISIGGSIMHNLAISLKHQGYVVTGSDDQIFEPSRSRLLENNLLPDSMGWDPDKITEELDEVILGMHARPDNPELKKALDIGLPVYSYPEYFSGNMKEKRRIVIAGSHGKTTTTGMILHVLKNTGINTDFLVGAQLPGYQTMVRMSKGGGLVVIEGDEYFSSAIDPVPKIMHYDPDISLITGIAWDHINVFKTQREYYLAFEKFVKSLRKNTDLIYCAHDEILNKLCSGFDKKLKLSPYSIPDYVLRDGRWHVKSDGEFFPMSIFGRHNMMNLEGARIVCNMLGITDKKYYEAMTSFQGASRRMEVLAAGNNTVVYRDFAHSPSKLSATLDALREKHESKKIIALFELHTYSSLNKEFLRQYKGTMKKADVKIILFNKKSLAKKKLDEFDEDYVVRCFKDKNLIVTTSTTQVKKKLLKNAGSNNIFILMGSGDFGGMNIKELSHDIISG